MPERDQTRVNERIRVPEVRLIGEDGQQVGVLKLEDALTYARERDLDLVEVAGDAKPPVCRVLDYSKYKYEQAQKQKAARKHQQQIVIREIKLRPKIAINDYNTKKGHVVRFLNHRDKVKVTIMFRGREMAHPERGEMLLQRLAEDLGELAIVEQRPLQDGRNMTMMLGPGKTAGAPKVEADGVAGEPLAEGAAPAAPSPDGAGPTAATSVAEPAAADPPAGEPVAEPAAVDPPTGEPVAEPAEAEPDATDAAATDAPAATAAPADAATAPAPAE